MRIPEHRGEKELHLPKQLGLPFYGNHLDIDGLQDAKREDVRYIGKATHVFDGTFRCLAIVCGALCIVEATITPSSRMLSYQEV